MEQAALIWIDQAAGPAHGMRFEGEFGDGEARHPPFRSFGKEYYTHQILIDLKVDEGFAIQVETHPSDTTGTFAISP
jgi:hypothetical protein